MEETKFLTKGDIDELKMEILLIQEQQRKILESTKPLDSLVNTIEEIFISIPKWFSLSDIAEMKSMAKDSIRKKLYNGEFEEGIDFKKIGHKIMVNLKALPKIYRERAIKGGSNG